MKHLDQNLIETIQKVFKGKKLENFNNCVKIINESLSQGGWTKRGSIKSQKGFSQGLTKYLGFQKNYELRKYDPNTGNFKETPESILEDKTLNFSRALTGSSGSQGFNLEDVGNCYHLLQKSTNREGKLIKIKSSLEECIAWVQLCDQVKEARNFLDSSRPIPEITEIGVSPRVTKTLNQMGIGAESYSIKLAKLERKERIIKQLNKKTGKMEKIRDVWYEVVWPKDIIHNKSRFTAMTENCEACGRNIPSNMFVAMELHRNDGDKYSMWVGTDCAKNIFGIKDVGVNLADQNRQS